MMTKAGYGLLIFFLILLSGVIVAFIIRIGKFSFAGTHNKRLRKKDAVEPTDYIPAIVTEKRKSYSRESDVTPIGRVGWQLSDTKTLGHFYITFKFEDDRKAEVEVSGSEYDMLHENSEVIVMLNGTDYLGYKIKEA